MPKGCPARPECLLTHLGRQAGSRLTAEALTDIFYISNLREVAMPDEAMLVRFRARDSKEGISRTTMKKVARALDLSETAAVHRALVEFAQRYVPQYSRDNGPISEAQKRTIDAIVRKKHGKALVVESLFEEPSSISSEVKSSGRKRISTSRPG
jgi:hypothetical protein